MGEKDMSLVGKVIQVHNSSNSEKVRLFMVVDGPDDLENGQVNRMTVDLWVKHGLQITKFKEMNEGTSRHRHKRNVGLSNGNDK